VSYARERLLLQIFILVASLVPLVAGGYGVLGNLSSDPALGGHLRYLSGLLLAIGLAFAWCAKRIGARTIEIRLLTFLVAVGGVARLLGLPETGLSNVTLLALFMELVVTPAICLWQSRIATSPSTHRCP
jgi:hypothetical protein